MARNKVAIVTGAGCCIGRAIACVLFVSDCNVAITSNVQTELDSTEKRIVDTGGVEIYPGRVGIAKGQGNRRGGSQ